jgi:hypothetical protein
VDTFGNAYVSENNHLIRLILPNGTVSTFAGGANVFADGIGTFSSFLFPKQLFFGTNGDLVVADSVNCRIRTVTPQGMVNTIAGNSNALLLDGFGTTSSFNSPSGVTVSSNGVIFVGDSKNNRIRKLTCELCPVSYSCSSGAPIICPTGNYCPLNSLIPIPCPAMTYSALVGAFSNLTCLPCPTAAYSIKGSSSCTYYDRVLWGVCDPIQYVRLSVKGSNNLNFGELEVFNSTFSKFLNFNPKVLAAAT